MRHTVLFILLSVIISRTALAQLTLNIPSQVCKDESLLMRSNSSKTIIQYNWSYGDGKTSEQSVPFYRYSVPGLYVIQLNVKFSDNTTGSASTQIEVFDVPNAQISLSDKSIICLNTNLIILDDLSVPGKNSNSITRRLILWGDGDISEASNPLLPDVIDHHYGHAGVFDIDIEYENDKKCKTKTKLTAVVHDFTASAFSVQSPSGKCDSLRICVKPKQEEKKIDLIQLNWDDGNESFTYAPLMCHYYKHSRSYAITMIARDKSSGCVDTTVQKVLLNVGNSIFPKFQKRFCLGETGYFQIPGNENGNVTWKLMKDSLITSNENLFAYTFPDTGIYHLEASYKNGNCIQVFKEDISVVGFNARIQALNANRPYLKDTIFFNAVINPFEPDRYNILWDFDDSISARCTSSVLNSDNCRYSTSIQSKHFYAHKGSFKVTLNIYDKETGCRFTDTLELTNNIDTGDCECKAAKDYCENDIVGKPFKIKMRPWYQLDSVLYDLYCPDKFLAPEKVVYKMPCSSSGYITSILKITQDNKIYGSNDSNNFRIDSSIVPHFAAIYIDWLRIRPSPKASFRMYADSCPPGNVVFELNPNPIYDLDYISVDWGDGSYYNKILNPNVAFKDKLLHRYNTKNPFFVRASITNLYQCSLEMFDTFNFYHKSYISEPPYGCDPVVELKSFTAPSTQPGKTPEITQYMWDDGDGLRYGKANHTVYFAKPGIYPIKLVTVNQFKCTDTVQMNVTINGLRAGIKSITKKLLCDDIIQFRDSSQIFGPEYADTIVKYTWNFGEGRAVSHLKNPFYYYRSQGEKVITLKVESAKGCEDTVHVKIEIPGPIPYFSLIDTIGCVPFTVEVDNQSKNARDYIWFMGDPAQTVLSTQSDTNFKFTYSTPGTYHIKLFASDSVENPDNQNELYYCGYYFPDENIPSHPDRKVIVLPAPTVSMSFSEIACLSKELKLVGQSSDAEVEYTWKLNGQVFSNEKPLTLVKFKTKGQQTLSLNVVKKVNGREIKCEAHTERLINVFGSKPPLEVIRNEECISYTFKTHELDNAKYIWSVTYGGREYGKMYNSYVDYDFKSYTGHAKVCVSVRDQDQCVDTTCADIEVDSMKFRMIPYNVFTPGTDGKNDIFHIEVENCSYYRIDIFNRWGELVFYSTSPDYGWDGNDYITGHPAADGTYFYVLETAGLCAPDLKKRKMSGTVTLLREKP